MGLESVVARGVQPPITISTNKSKKSLSERGRRLRIGDSNAILVIVVLPERLSAVLPSRALVTSVLPLYRVRREGRGGVILAHVVVLLSPVATPLHLGEILRVGNGGQGLSDVWSNERVLSQIRS